MSSRTSSLDEARNALALCEKLSQALQQLEHASSDDILAGAARVLRVEVSIVTRRLKSIVKWTATGA